MDDLKLYVSDIVEKIVDKVCDTTVVCVAVENDGYWVKNRNNNGYTTIMPKNIYKVPTIPFYHSSWIYKGEYIKPEVQELRNAIERQYGKINRTKGLIACPSDAFPVDIRMLEETFQLMGMFKCKLINETALPAINGMMDYITVSVSERLIILEVYRDGDVAENKYFDKSTFDMEELVEDINSICYEENLDVYLFDSTNELAALNELGEIITGNDIMDMLGDAARVLFNIAETGPQQQQMSQNNRQRQLPQNQMNSNGNGGYSEQEWRDEQLQFGRQGQGGQRQGQGAQRQGQGGQRQGQGGQRQSQGGQRQNQGGNYNSPNNWNNNQGGNYNNQDNWNNNQNQNGWNNVNSEQHGRNTNDNWSNANNNSHNNHNRNNNRPRTNQLQIGMNGLNNGQDSRSQMNNRQQQNMQNRDQGMNNRQVRASHDQGMNNRQARASHDQGMNNRQNMPGQNVRRNMNSNNGQNHMQNSHRQNGNMNNSRQPRQGMNNRQQNGGNMNNNYNQQANWNYSGQNNNWSNNQRY